MKRLAISVTRLCSIVTNFLTKVTHKFGNFLGLVRKLRVGQIMRIKWLLFITSGHTGGGGGGGIVLIRSKIV